jgi:hypothetical protein
MDNYSFGRFTLDNFGRLVDNLPAPETRYQSKLDQIPLEIFTIQETGYLATAKVEGSFLRKYIYAFSWGGLPSQG